MTAATPPPQTPTFQLRWVLGNISDITSQFDNTYKPTLQFRYVTVVAKNGPTWSDWQDVPTEAV